MAVSAEIPADVLSALYATASDRSKWQSFCDVLNRHTSERILLFGHDIAQRDSLGIIASGVQQEALDVYHEYYADLNPWMHMNMVMPAGFVGISDQALPREELFKTEFYNDWLRHQEDVVAGPALMCYRTEERFVAMAAACRSRHADTSVSANQALFESLSPHMLQVVNLSYALSGNEKSFRYLDRIGHAVFVVNQSGRIGYLNDAADALLSRSKPFGLSFSRQLTSSDDMLKLHLRRSVRLMREQQFHSVPAPVRLQTSSDEWLVLHTHIFPIEEDLPFPTTSWLDPPVGAFVVSNSERLGERQSYKRLARVLGATPAVAKLAAALLDRQSLKDYEEETGLSPHTVSNQMRALLHKTGSRSQAEFVRKLLRLQSPFENSN